MNDLSPFLLIVLFTATVAIISFIVAHFVRKSFILRRRAEKEKTELREKISRDLHDDLASTLGSISIYAGTLQGMKEARETGIAVLASKITELSQSALQSITDIIWMTSPRNDSLQNLLSKTGAMMFDVLTDNGIRYAEQVELPRQQIIISDKLRHDTFLILKEALNNIIRHAKATQVTFRADCEGKICTLHLSDNGKGFPLQELPASGSGGNGLVNMRRRAQESGIDLRIESTVESGSRVELSFRI